MALVTVQQFCTPWTDLIYNDRNLQVDHFHIAVPASEQDVRMILIDQAGTPQYVIDMLAGQTRDLLAPAGLKVVLGPTGGIGLGGNAGEWGYTISQPPGVDYPNLPHL